MKVSNSGILLIKKHEGFRNKAYKCPAGVWTIGYGHTSGVREGMIITEAQGEAFLKQDILTAENEVSRQLKNIGQNQFDALVSFTYNVGTGNFRGSTLLKKIKINPNDSTIRGEFAKWNKGGGTVLPGLTKRRNEEAELYFKK
jgi:lysozyme